MLAPLIVFVLTSGTLTGKIVGVQDGDTITLLTSEKVQHKIRLYGIDAPEGGQAFGRKSKSYLSGLVFDKTVTISLEDVDRYQRIVGRVSVAGRDVNLAVVEAGWAWWYRKYAPKDKKLRDAEERARLHRRGQWRDDSPIPPWGMGREP